MLLFLVYRHIVVLSVVLRRRKARPQYSGKDRIPYEVSNYKYSRELDITRVSFYVRDLGVGDVHFTIAASLVGSLVTTTTSYNGTRTSTVLSRITDHKLSIILTHFAFIYML